MSEVLVLAGILIGIVVLWRKENLPNKPWYRNVNLILGLTSLILAAAISVMNYRASINARQQALARERTLSTNITKLRSQVQSLSDQNHTLRDMLGDSNATGQAIAAKLHASRHLKRGVSEKLKQKDSVTAVPKNK